MGIGAKLRQERVDKGIRIDDISRDTRISPRFLEAIETDDYAILPGLVFTRNFIRQYALALQIDPDPLLAELPKPDELAAPLPDPPARARADYRWYRSIISSAVWLLILGGAGAGIAAYMRFNHQSPAVAAQTAPPVTVVHATSVPAPSAVEEAPAALQQKPTAGPETAGAAPAQTPLVAAPVQVSLTARQTAWVRVVADGKPAFVGMIHPDETIEVSALDQINVSAGNAGALIISLNGKTLDSLGPLGQTREVKLTAEGPQFPSKAHQPVYYDDAL